MFIIQINRCNATNLTGIDENIERTDVRSLHKKGTDNCTGYHDSNCSSLPEPVKLRSQLNLEELIDAEESESDESNGDGGEKEEEN